MKEEKTTEQLVTEAVQGSKDALEEIIRRIQEPVYSLALRMLLHPSDAEDAAQEILTTVVTNLRGYRFEGTFRAWVMRIAANKLKLVRKTFMERKISSVGELDEIMDRAEALGWFSQPLEAPKYLISRRRLTGSVFRGLGLGSGIFWKNVVVCSMVRIYAIAA